MKIAVYDLGTRASRLIIGDTEAFLANGFDFNDFINRSEITEAGKGLFTREDGKQEMYLEQFDKTVEFIKTQMVLCGEQGVKKENIYAVGTELFRRVENRRRLVDIIELNTGVRIKILDPQEEANCSFWAVGMTCCDYFNQGNPNGNPFLVIEQGGGSTQITVGQIDANGKNTIHAQTSIPELGTLFLRQKFMNVDGRQSGKRRVGAFNKEVQKYAAEKIDDVLKSKFTLPDHIAPKFAFGIGTAIRRYFKMPSRRIHGEKVTKENLENDLATNNKFNDYEKKLMKSLLQDAGSAFFESKEDMQEMLEKLYGLPCYVQLLDHFGLDYMRACGTGLRYGVLFRIAYGDWENIKEYDPE